MYAFFDYDGEPIYVGQTRESLGSRIGRHLTNQRTDVVAMAVLDPFEVRSIKVWPLPEYQTVRGDDARGAADHLNALERTVFLNLVQESALGKILNEKDPPDVAPCALPTGIVGDIVSEEVRRVRQHPDLRIARRAQTIARLAQTIAGRDVQAGLRRALATQADRLAWIASQRFAALAAKRRSRRDRRMIQPRLRRMTKERADRSYGVFQIALQRIRYEPCKLSSSSC